LTRALLASTVLLAGCGQCTLFGPARWDVAIWNLPDDVDTVTVTQHHFYGSDECFVRFEGMDTRFDWGPGPDEPDIVEEDCPDSPWVYTYMWALHVNSSAPNRFASGRVDVAYTTLGGETGGFEGRQVWPAWGYDSIGYSEAFCNSGSSATNHIDALTGDRVYPP